MMVPELVVTDLAAAQRQLCDVFGFARDGGVLRLGSQAIVLRQGSGGHGVIDHLALSVPDLDAAAAVMIARGAVVEGTTPDGAQLIPEFWRGGMRYLFLTGPDGARIELCHNLADPKPLGHDHIGIPCTDIAASEAFVTGLGGRLVAAVTLTRAEGDTLVRFIELSGGVLELYMAPVMPPLAPHGCWNRLLVPGLAAPVTGPDGLHLAPL
ncbi:MAG: VOC family protein [Pseudomonadota bacterium]